MKTILGLFFGIAVMITQGIAADEGASQGPLQQLLRGANIGMVFSECVAAHPEAVYSDSDLRTTPVTPDKPGALLIEQESDPVFGLHAFANIGFKEGTAYELAAVWSGPPDKVAKARSSFFRAVIDRHGHAYARQAIRVYPGSVEERAAPVMLWQDAKTAVLAFYTPPSSLDRQDRATLTYAQFQAGDPFLNDILSKNAPDAEQRDLAWKDLDPVLREIESASEKTPAP